MKAKISTFGCCRFHISSEKPASTFSHDVAQAEARWNVESCKVKEKHMQVVEPTTKRNSVFTCWVTVVFLNVCQHYRRAKTHIVAINVLEICRRLSDLWTNGTEIFGNSGKSEKKEIPQKVLPFFRNLSTGMNRSIWIRPGITENSIQMVSAPVVPTRCLLFLATNGNLTLLFFIRE